MKLYHVRAAYYCRQCVATTFKQIARTLVPPIVLNIYVSIWHLTTYVGTEINIIIDYFILKK